MDEGNFFFLIREYDVYAHRCGRTINNERTRRK